MTPDHQPPTTTTQQQQAGVPDDNDFREASADQLRPGDIYYPGGYGKDAALIVQRVDVSPNDEIIVWHETDDGSDDMAEYDSMASVWIRRSVRPDTDPPPPASEPLSAVTSDQLLDEARHRAAAILTDRDDGFRRDDDDAVELAEAITALDRYLTAGRGLPRGWRWHVLVQFTRGDAERLIERRLTHDEGERIARAVDHSTIPEAFGDIVTAVTEP